MPTAEEAVNQAWQIHQSGDLAQAERMYRQALTAQPGSARAWCHLGMACHDQERYEEAIAAYQRAIQLRPEFPVAFNNMGNSLWMLRRLDDALVCFNRALELKPDYGNAYKNRGTVLLWYGRTDEALASYERSLVFNPNDAETHTIIGVIRLMIGDFAGGWPEYEWRWKTTAPLPKLDGPLWDGSPLEGKTILLTPEQGLGDSIHFIRYGAWLKEKYDCRVILHCPSQLRQLLKDCPGIDEWVDQKTSPPPFDFFAPLVHVPAVLQHTPDDFPDKVPYLSADESLIHKWRERLAPYPGRKIGIAWRGSPKHHADKMRSIPLTEFAPLGRLKGIQFFSLQKGPGAEELNSLAGRLDVVDLGQELDANTGAFVETAAVLKNLDLLIACDTAVGHVAGALGLPVWLALCNVPDWRWKLQGDSSRSYPSLRLFRQTKFADWTPVFEQMSAALEQQFPEVQKKHYTDYRLAGSGFNRLSRGRHGLVLYNRHDMYIGRSLDRYGEFSIGEADLFRQLIRPGSVVVEAGANIGAHTLVLSRLVGDRGLVYAFEPQRVVFQTLCANMALSSIVNVHCRSEVLGDAPGTVMIPVPNYNEENNFGGLSVGGKVGEPVSVITLDSLELPRCDFLKVDVEGMELSVLKGAAQTIAKYRPVLYVENDRADRSAALIEYLFSLGYELYWHLPPLFDRGNFYQNPVNEFGTTVSVNMLGIHSSVKSNISGLRKVEGPHSDWRQRGP
jgi:FkbM family methyltransferase